MSNDADIKVTRPSLPALDDFVAELEQIWASGIVTNCGPYHQKLEAALSDYLGVKHVCLFDNGTNALIAALHALDLRGEVITTPFSFIATSHALLWKNLTPVFADIDPQTFNLDPAAVEAAITDRTSAILPVHCYGRPCDTSAFEGIASRHNLSLIYDAAHAFSVCDHGGSILRHGNVSVLSFHATKIFSTFEGGAIVTDSDEMKERIARIRNFGIQSETVIDLLGFNGKMNELCAAMGLLQLKQIDNVISLRSQIDQRYRQALSSMPGLYCPPLPAIPRYNHAYFPILVRPDFPLSRDQLYEQLIQQGIHSRRYFYPLLCDVGAYKALPPPPPLPHARLIANQVLCLPLYPNLNTDQQNRIINAIRRAY